MKALVADDSRSIRRLIASIVRDLGTEVHEAEHGRQALDLLQRIGPFDFALVDWNMPEMTGLDFIRAVRADPAYRRLVIVMVTTETEAEQMLKALTAGADEYLMKPFDRRGLLEKLALVGIAPAIAG